MARPKRSPRCSHTAGNSVSEIQLLIGLPRQDQSLESLALSSIAAPVFFTSRPNPAVVLQPASASTAIVRRKAAHAFQTGIEVWVFAAIMIGTPLLWRSNEMSRNQPVVPR